MPIESEEALIARLLALPVLDRADYVRRACTDRPGLRERLHQIAQAVATLDPATKTMPVPASDDERSRAMALAFCPEETESTTIGVYKLLQKIGEGGFGVVWMAEQQEPVRRRVALKVIKSGMDTREVIARFEAERQALALMDHPNIARVFDAGATDVGQPYFVMELVRGISITRYCDENRLSTTARLNLFIAVCHAVQHAHQKGIIHRDLKPSNILVTLHDGVPMPKIIDFGIAKATATQLTGKTLFTRFHAFIGTPAYTSPEQMEMSGLDVDTRSDIYSLGVLLYELLAGQPPFDPDALMKSGLEAMRHTIREVDPPPPSQRVRTFSEEVRATVALQRGTSAAKFSLQLRGDLDWIVMHCLEKDRTRRYETANDLANDVRCHLTDQPVAARPPSAADRLRKLVRRHRLVFAAAGAVVLALVAGLAMTFASLMRERASAAQARTEAAKSAQVAEFMKEMFIGIGPSRALGRNTEMLREIVDRTARRLDTELRDQPQVAADLRETLGAVYRELGQYEKSEALLRVAVETRRKTAGDESPALATALDGLGETLLRLGQRAEAETKLQEALAIRRKVFGESHPAYADTLFHLALMLNKGRTLDDVERMLHEVLAIRRKAFGDEHRSIADTLAQLGLVAGAQSDHKKAMARHTEALAMYRKLLDPDDPSIALALKELGHAHAHVGRRTEAIQAYREAFDLHHKVLGDQHPKTVVAFLRTIEQTAASGADPATIGFVREFIASQRKLLPTGSPLLAPALLALAAFLESRPEDPNEILQLRSEATRLLEQSRTSGPKLDAEIIPAMEQFAWWRHNNRVPAEGLTMIEETIKLADATFGPEEDGSLAPNRTLGWIYFRLHRLDAAIAQFEKAILLDQRWVKSFHVYTCVDTAVLAAAYREAGHPAESRRRLEESLAIWDHGKPDDPPPPTNIAVARAELGITLNRIGEFIEAERVLRQSLQEYELDALPPLSARNRPRGRAESALGQALVGQGRFAEAEPLLVQALQNLQSTRDILAGDAAGVLREAQEAIVALYVAWGKPDKAAEWRTVQP